MGLSRITHSVLFGALIGGILLGFVAVGILFDYNTPSVPYVVPEIHSQYEATCRIKTKGGGISTGVLLNTGFILACGHGVDDNRNWKADPEEREVTLEFFTKDSMLVGKGRLVIIGYDYSIIKPYANIKSEVFVSLDIPLVGESVYTFGFPLAQGIHLTKGYQSSPSIDKGTERTSISAYMGNSGGSVFNKNGETVGILKSIGIDNRRSYVVFAIPDPLKNGEGIRIIHTYVDYQHALSNWSEYIRNKDIYSAISKRGLGWTMVQEEQLDTVFNYTPFIKCFLQIWVVLICAMLFSRELFLE